MAERHRRKIRVGKVISDKMHKTIVVEITRTMLHPLYQRVVKTSAKLYAHDERAEAKLGDTVRVMECRPLSKLKRWRLVEIMDKAK